MSALAKSLLLFVLNWLDAQLTLLWVHTNVATEGNGLMGQLLSIGDAPFLLVKLAVGAFAAFILYRCSHLPIARRGMQLVLMIYGLLMITHVAVGMSALGWHPPETIIGYLASVPSTVLAWLS